MALDQVNGGTPLSARISMAFAKAWPAPSTIVIGSILAGLSYAVVVVLGLWWWNELKVVHLTPLLTLYFAGGALAFGPGLYLVNLFFARRRLVGSLVAAFLLILFAHAVTAGLFALQYRLFYAVWHAAFPSVVWGFQFAFTSAGAIYQFTVNNMYYLLPGGPLLYLVTTWWLFSRAPVRTR